MNLPIQAFHDFSAPSLQCSDTCPQGEGYIIYLFSTLPLHRAEAVSETYRPKTLALQRPQNALSLGQEKVGLSLQILLKSWSFIWIHHLLQFDRLSLSMAINQPQFQDLGLKMVYTPKLPPMFMGKLIENYEPWMIFGYPHFQILLRTYPARSSFCRPRRDRNPFINGVFPHAQRLPPVSTPEQGLPGISNRSGAFLVENDWKWGGLNMGLVLDKLRILPPWNMGLIHKWGTVMWPEMCAMFFYHALTLPQYDWFTISWIYHAKPKWPFLMGNDRPLDLGVPYSWANPNDWMDDKISQALDQRRDIHGNASPHEWYTTIRLGLWWLAATSVRHRDILSCRHQTSQEGEHLLNWALKRDCVAKAKARFEEIKLWMLNAEKYQFAPPAPFMISFLCIWKCCHTMRSWQKLRACRLRQLHRPRIQSQLIKEASGTDPTSGLEVSMIPSDSTPLQHPLAYKCIIFHIWKKQFVFIDGWFSHYFQVCPKWAGNYRKLPLKLEKWWEPVFFKHPIWDIRIYWFPGCVQPSLPNMLSPSRYMVCLICQAAQISLDRLDIHPKNPKIDH